MRRWLNVFIYVSVVFLLYALWREDYLQRPDIHNVYYLVISIIFLCIAYMTKSIVWREGLKLNGINVSFKDSIASTGIAELGKYIPGKLWVIVGRALYISQQADVPIEKTSTISFNVQLLVIWSGLLIGSIGLFLVPIPRSWVYLALAGWIFLSMVLFNRWFHYLIRRLVSRIMKRKIEIPIIDAWNAKRMLLFLLGDWLARMLGFYFLLASLSQIPVDPVIASGYPLAVTLGIIAIIAPGGIGVREGVIVIWLQAAGFSWELATTMAVATRIWSLIGELGIFFTGLVLKRT
jgi:uncharacterized membrane protein YbhN (UPF0104 family)